MKIPVNVDSLPTELPEFDESVPYRAVIRRAELSDTKDVNGNNYITSMDLEILEPQEFRNRHVYENYICVPNMEDGMSAGERKAAEEKGIKLKRFVLAFRVPYDEDGITMEDVIGCEGDVTLYNDEYQGRKMGKVKDYLI